MIWTATVVGLFLFTASASSEQKASPGAKEKLAAVKLPACAACGALVSSFEKGFDNTSKGKLDGGNTAWEEKNQGASYAASEIRLVEIEEHLCEDLERGRDQCHENRQAWDEHIEQWWHSGRETSLRQWLCVDKLNVCCPEDHFGPNCLPCDVMGANGKVCSGNGKCKGGGTRKGNGRCACEKGYTGERCDACDAGFYAALGADGSVPLLCSACHKSCAAHCSAAGPKACVACGSGFVMDTEHGCTDLNECFVSTPCVGNRFCVNTEGSFMCMQCDKACEGCEGDGPDSCEKCAEGYTLNKDKVCISDQAAGKIFTISNARFFTYLGLCIAACIICQSSFVVAGIMGVVIAAYISFSEYYLQTSSGELRPI